MRQALFFEQTTEAIKALTGVLDNFASALIAIRNMRCEIRGILAECPDFTEEMFHARYHFDAKMRWKNYKTVFSSQDFAAQEEAFTWYLLNEACTVFEGWLAAMESRGIITHSMVKDLQFPITADNVLSRYINSSNSVAMTTLFYPVYKANKKYSYQRINATLYCYRIFKEIRNSFVHNAKLATQKCLDAYADYVANCSKASLAVVEVPIVNSMILNGKITPSFRGVIGLTDIVIRLLVSYDSELIQTIAAERYFIGKFKASSENRKMLSSNQGKAQKQLIGRIRKCGFAAPVNIEDMKRFLSSNGFGF